MLIDAMEGHVPEMLEVAADCGLFDEPQLGVLLQTIERHFRGESERHELWLNDLAGDRVISVAYCAEEVMTDRVWNLLFIAVRTDFQNQGRGGRVLGQVEAALQDRGCRMLIIETASGEDFADTRAFYEKHGYDREGTVRDFYEQGVDKIVFRKLL
ncbi:MAG: GNAT family N-acetyltransferase [Planctomycetota bacterium]